MALLCWFFPEAISLEHLSGDSQGETSSKLSIAQYFPYDVYDSGMGRTHKSLTN